jgi:hypothetical protein
MLQKHWEWKKFQRLELVRHQRALLQLEAKKLFSNCQKQLWKLLQLHMVK